MKNKGITLVALVITIVILLILAGITISQLTGSGLFENAKLAEQKSKEAQEKEDGILGDYENKIGQYVNGSRDGVTLTEEQWQVIQDEISTLKTKVSTLESNFNIKTYTNISQLGLSGYTTVMDIFNTMPNGSTFEAMITTSIINETGLDIPTKGILRIYKHNNQDGSCQLTTINNEFYIRLFSWDGNATNNQRDTGWTKI